MGELDITIHTRDLAPCFSATPSHCQIVNWRAYPETPSRAHALRKNARGAYWLRSRGLIGSTRTRTSSAPAPRHYAER